jgi:preprotein translocase subunit SecB
MSSGIDSVLKLTDFRAFKTYFEVAEHASGFDKSRLNMAIDVSVLQSDDSEGDMAVRLKVDLNRDADQFAAAGFTGSVVIAGFFDVGLLKSEHPDDWEPLLIFNGVTVLVGTVRTVYADLSAASPVGRIVLPAINVGQMLDDAVERTDQDGLTN